MENSSAVSMTEQEVKALRAVVAYLYEDEQKHWEESDKPENHIFVLVKTLSKFINNTYGKAN